MSLTDNFCVSVLRLKKKKRKVKSISVYMLMNGIRISFYYVFVHNRVNSPLICDFVKQTLFC